MPERSVSIAPSILTADLTRLADEIGRVEAAGAELLHLDVMDGVFVPNISIGVPVVASIRRATRLPLDVHLMITQPERYIEAFAEAGADSLTVHVEGSSHLHRVVQQIRSCGVRPAVALNPATPLVMLEEILPEVDMVLVMSVNPGFGGQRFIPSALDKIRRLRAELSARGLTARIQTDGGIKADNVRLVAEAGADVVVVGSAIFNPEQSVADAMRSLRAALS